MYAIVSTAARVAATAVVIVLAAMAGGIVARRMRQDTVVGEIAVGLLVGPAALVLAGPGALRWLLPPDVTSAVKLIGEVGLVLFLVGVTHGLRLGRGLENPGTVGWVTVGAFLLPLCLGGLLGGWLLARGDPAVRGTTPAPAFLLFVAVALAITAVPVMSRILVDRGMDRTRVGRLSLASAVVQDSVGWLVLSVAIGLSASSMAGLVRVLLLLAGGAAVAVLLRVLLRTRRAAELAAGHRAITAMAIAAVALALALALEHLGLTSIFGAALVGLAVPADEGAPWRRPVERVARLGRRLVPLFFVITGVSVFAAAPTGAAWALTVMVTVLGTVGKLGGGYLGARVGGLGRWDAMRTGALMNTRGLTELVVLQIGYSAGILTGPFFLAFVVMALVTTACTGPALAFIGRQDSPARVPHDS